MSTLLISLLAVAGVFGAMGTIRYLALRRGEREIREERERVDATFNGISAMRGRPRNTTPAPVVPLKKQHTPASKPQAAETSPTPTQDSAFIYVDPFAGLHFEKPTEDEPKKVSGGGGSFDGGGSSGDWSRAASESSSPSSDTTDSGSSDSGSSNSSND